MLEQIAYGEMGMIEQEFDCSTTRYFVLRLNGMRAREERDDLKWNWRLRRVAYLAGQFKRGTREVDIWRFDYESRTTIDELYEARDLIEANWGPIAHD